MEETITVLGKGSVFSDASSPRVLINFSPRLTKDGEREVLYKQDAEALMEMLRKNLPQRTFDRLKALMARELTNMFFQFG